MLCMVAHKLQIFLDLMQIVENGFIFKLKASRPDITDEEVEKAVTEWYRSKPEPGFDNPDCERGDISRFFS